jgi:predicted dithiol-disulfide oxidoreductase (DUF899 family)
MDKPRIASAQEWQQARDELLTAEKQATRTLDAIAARLFVNNMLDLAPYGRQQDWEDSPPGWPQHPTYG